LKQKLVQAGYREADVATLDRTSLLEFYAKVVLTETAYVPVKEEQDMKVKMVVVIVMRRLSLLWVRQMCSILPVVITRLRRGVLQWKKKDLARGNEIGGTDNATRIRGEKAGRAEVATGRAQFEERTKIGETEETA